MGENIFYSAQSGYKTNYCGHNQKKNDLFYITKECRFRNFMHPDQLDKCTDYLRKQFAEISSTVEFQKYRVDSVEYKNVICTIGPNNAERIIIGAHYDACLDKEGADDNASGVCGLLELARLLKKKDLKYRFEFVAYANEEPLSSIQRIWAVIFMPKDFLMIMLR